MKSWGRSVRGGDCGFNTLLRKADELITLKYVVKNVAHRNGHTATFMPKPIVGDNGSGMHVHQSLAKGARTCSRAMAMAGCRSSRFGTSAASSSTRRRSAPSPTRPRTATSCLVPGFRSADRRSPHSALQPFGLPAAFRGSPARKRPVGIEIRFPRSGHQRLHLVLLRAAHGRTSTESATGSIPARP